MSRPAQAHGAVTGTTSTGADDWRHRAACLDEDPELFFPLGHTGIYRLQIEEAKAVCRRCPVMDACLQWANETDDFGYGVWGGLTEDERRALKRRNRATRHAPTAERDMRRADMLAALPGLAAAGKSIGEAARILETAPNYLTRILAEQPALLEQLRRNADTPKQPSVQAALIEELDHLAGIGADIHEAARVTGRKVSYIERLTQDRGRHDLLARLRRTAA